MTMSMLFDSPVAPVVLLATLALLTFWVTAVCRILAANFDLHRSRHNLVVEATQMRLDYYRSVDVRRGAVSDNGFNVDVMDEDEDALEVVDDAEAIPAAEVAGTIGKADATAVPARQAA